MVDITPIGFEKAIDKLTAEQLDTPVDEVDAEPAAESVPEEAIKPETKEETEVESEEQVPKSRFLTVHKRAVDAERALRALEAERASTPVEITPLEDDETLKKFYTDTFGEGELTEKLYKNELARLGSIEERAANRAYERFSQREQVEQETINQRVASFDAAFEELAIEKGKTEFTDDEQVALLDIVEKYSPKDKGGKLIGDFLMPLDQAYEIYEMQNDSTAQVKKQERNKVASLIGAKTEGTASPTNDADWNPNQQRRWWDKVK